MANRRTHKSMDELHKNFNEINYLKLFEFLFNKQNTIKNESKSALIRKFFNFLEKNSKLPSKNSNNDLESKLEQMKHEIEQLKTKLNCTVQDSKNLSILVNEKSPSTMQAQQLKNLKPNEYEVIKTTNCNILQKQISNKISLIPNLNGLNDNNKASDQVCLAQLTQAHTRDTYLIERLQKDLILSNEKNSQLEKILEEKSKQIDHYGKLFR